MGLTPPLINLIVHTCFEYDAVLTNNLADRIANDWLQNGITTPTEAIAYLKERKNKRNHVAVGIHPVCALFSRT